ncbi:LptA/OstA family protein [Phaeobacter sp. QD34_3]|uniref:LptA/OstA family protein n=1 Tax=unclassified Phaeobacter TaxID=2621772 RepID=UPI00237F716E|nr:MULTISPECIES: LptA/OstA family protein [unclassified Phaeobacter]MDE4134330.1 LptA/OstA family protein [Phaeobacter sp. QD34_3]MDE4137663.1 LptA/OstA family protein [Phaeobacter sp. QD34_24]MDE4172914.1 LptA/OstA family protein [Phaeobacter sp. PT47_59]
MILVVCALAAQAPVASAQSGTIAFGAVKTDPKEQVEVTADALAVNQADGSAEFSGNVLIIQGVMRLSADRVLVIYKTDAAGKRGIDQLEATGNVLLVSGPDAAEAERAKYTIDSGTIVMSGNVLLSQGDSTLTSNRMEVNLTTGTASMAGRVKTILNPDGND